MNKQIKRTAATYYSRLTFHAKDKPQCVLSCGVQNGVMHIGISMWNTSSEKYDKLETISLKGFEVANLAMAFEFFLAPWCTTGNSAGILSSLRESRKMCYLTRNVDILTGNCTYKFVICNDEQITTKVTEFEFSPANTFYHKGYTEYIPKDVFEQFYVKLLIGQLNEFVNAENCIQAYGITECNKYGG